MDTYDLARLASSFVLPLAEAVHDPDMEEALVAELGFVLPPGITLVSGFRPVLESVTGVIIELEEHDSAQGASDFELLQRAAGALESVTSTVRNLSSLVDAGALASELLRNTDALQVLPQRLLGYLTVCFLETNFPVLYQLLRTCGVVEEQEIAQEDDPQRVTYVQRTIRWDRISPLISDPVARLKEQYGWDSPAGVDTAALFTRLDALAIAMGLHSDIRAIDQRARQAFQLALAGAGSVPAAEDASVLRIPLLPTFDVGFGVELYPVTGTTQTVDGFGIGIYVDGDLSSSIKLSDWLAADVTLGAFGSGLGALLRSGQPARLVSAIYVSEPAQLLDEVAVDASASIIYQRPAGAAIVLLGKDNSTRWQAESIGLKAALAKPPDAELDISFELALAKSVLALQTDESDGFLKEVMGDGFTVEFDLALGFSIRRGLYFRGAGGLEHTIPLGRKAGPLSIESITVAVKSDLQRSSLVVSATGGLTLGPLAIVIKDVGLRATIDSSRPGILGNANLALGFKPPNGLGLAIDAASVAGGGDLYFDPDKGEYAGMLHLQIAERINVKAFGLLSTRLPDGTRGYSLIIFVTAEDFQPIQLGMGFKLLGIGGMLAVNRTFDEAALREGLKNDTLATLLFPQDPIHNAAAILRNLATVFPAQPGSYLFGPLAKIGWATPTLIQMELALILQIGARRRLLVLGRISSILPSRDKELIRLNMDAMGVLDFDVGTITLDAVLVDSRLLHKFVLTGSMAMRACLVPGRAAFALAVGGMNPHFAPPASMPKLERLTINLTSGDNPRFSCEAYFAVTANTIQFGSRSALYAAAHGFSVQGEVGFDVLVQLLPFHFLADFYASIQLKRGSTNLFKVKVAGALEGPLPLRVKAKASFEILWCDFSVRFDKTLIAGERPAPPPAVNALQELKRALSAPESWNADLPAARHGVVMRKLAADAPLALDPLGQLSVRQSVLPLNTSRGLDVFGGAPLSGARQFTITAASLNTAASSVPLTLSVRAVRDWFAPAQFFELSDEDKLASPSFEEMDSGIVFGSEAVVFDEAPAQRVYAPLKYDTITIDEAGEESAAPQPYELGGQRLHQQLRFAAVAKAAVRNTGLARFRHPGAGSAVRLASPHWLIASTTDLNVLAPQTSAGMSWGDAQVALKQLRRRQPHDATAWQLVPDYEVTR